VYIHKQGQLATSDLTPTHSTILHLVEGLGQKLYNVNYFSSPTLENKLLLYSLSQKKEHTTKFLAKETEDEER
jgi:hypothetical protein